MASVSNSMTITQTASDVEVINTTLRLRSLNESVKKSISHIEATVMASPIFSEKFRKDFAEWNDAFTKEYLASLKTVTERENAAYSVCFLISDLLRPVILAQDNNLPNLEILFGVEDELKDVIKQMLGENIEVEALLKNFEQSAKEEANLLYQLARIELSIEKGMKEIYDAAITQIEALNKRLQFLRLDELKFKFQQLYSAQQKTSEKRIETSIHLKTQLAKTNQVLKSAENLAQNNK